MSFKRDGDDGSTLNNQRKRRVADLLYEDIHEEELSKLRNGRYVCNVCPHRPIFDTVNMFQVHRQGKKHQHSLEYKESKKQEVKDIIFKRKHEEELKDEIIHNQTSKEESHLPLGCTKNSISGPYGRKMRLDFNVSTTSPLTIATAARSLPGKQIEKKTSLKNTQRQSSNDNPTDFKRQAEHSNNNVKTKINDIRDSNLTKLYRSLGGLSHRAPVEQQRGSEDDKHLKVNNVKQFISDRDGASKYYFSRKQQNTQKPLPNRTLNLERQHTVIEQHTSVSWDRFKQIKGKSFIAPVYQKKVRQETNDLQNSVCNVTDSLTSHKHRDLNNQNSVEQESVQIADRSDEKKTRAREFLNAFESGWKRDWNGGWIKDEEVEFDSDEEPPTVT